MSEFNLSKLEGQGAFQYAVDFATAKASVELVEGQLVKRVKAHDKGNGPFIIWRLADGSAVATPAGPSVTEGDDPRGLTYGWNDGMDTFVAFQSSDSDFFEV